MRVSFPHADTPYHYTSRCQATLTSVKTSLMHLLDQESTPIHDNPTAPIKPWQRLAALEFTNGTPFVDIAKMLDQPFEAVSAFITSEKGAEAIKNIVAADPERIQNLIDASAIDSVLSLIKIRDSGKSEPARIQAGLQLLERAVPKLRPDTSKTKITRLPGGLTTEEEINRLRLELKAGI